MVLFIVLSLVMLMLVTVAIEWVLERTVSSSSHPLADDAWRQGTPTERRLIQQAEFDAIGEELLWEQMVIAKGWPVSARFAQRTFAATTAAMKRTRASR